MASRKPENLPREKPPSFSGKAITGRAGGRSQRRLKSAGRRLSRSLRLLPLASACLRLEARSSWCFAFLSVRLAGESWESRPGGVDVRKPERHAAVQQRGLFNAQGTASEQGSSSVGRVSERDRRFLRGALPFQRRCNVNRGRRKEG